MQCTKNTSRFVLCLILIFVLMGCNESPQKSAPTQDAAKPKSVEYQNGRFVPIAPYNEGRMPQVGIPWHGFFALDTKTGALCRTLDKQFPQDWANTLPLCMELLGDNKPK